MDEELLFFFCLVLSRTGCSVVGLLSNTCCGCSVEFGRMDMLMELSSLAGPFTEGVVRLIMD